jgi:hypothetical protein
LSYRSIDDPLWIVDELAPLVGMGREQRDHQRHRLRRRLRAGDHQHAEMHPGLFVRERLSGSLLEREQGVDGVTRGAGVFPPLARQLRTKAVHLLEGGDSVRGHAAVVGIVSEEALHPVDHRRHVLRGHADQVGSDARCEGHREILDGIEAAHLGPPLEELDGGASHHAFHRGHRARREARLEDPAQLGVLRRVDVVEDRDDGLFPGQYLGRKRPGPGREVNGIGSGRPDVGETSQRPGIVFLHEVGGCFVAQLTVEGMRIGENVIGVGVVVDHRRDTSKRLRRDGRGRRDLTRSAAKLSLPAVSPRRTPPSVTQPSVRRSISRS